jgi:hypothetical protein
MGILLLATTLATLMVTVLAFTHRAAPIGLPARSLITSRHAVSGDMEDSRKAAKRAYNRRYYREQKLHYEENRDAISQQRKLYYEENKDAILHQVKLYYEENKDAIHRKHKLYYEENKDAINRKQKLYYEENRERISQKRKQK